MAAASQRHISAERFIAGLQKEGLAPATGGRTLTILKSIFEKGRQWGYLTRNPAVYIKKPQIPRKEWGGGMRQSEILGLQWSDIDWQSGRIYIRRVLQQGRFFEPKTQTSRRAVIVPPVLVEALRIHQLRQSVELDLNPLDLVFPNRVGRPMASRNLSARIFEPALRAAGLRKVKGVARASRSSSSAGRSATPAPS